MMADKKYVIWSNEHRVWWRSNENGYTVFRDLAGEYSFDDAKRIRDHANMFSKDTPQETMLPV